MSWLRFAHALGLTNLSDDDVRRYEERELKERTLLPPNIILQGSAIEYLRSQKIMTQNQWKIVLSFVICDIMAAFYVYIIGFGLPLVVRNWMLTYGESAVILVASSVGAPFGLVFYGWLADRIGRRSVMIASILNVSVATGVMA